MERNFRLLMLIVKVEDLLARVAKHLDKEELPSGEKDTDGFRAPKLHGFKVNDIRTNANFIERSGIDLAEVLGNETDLAIVGMTGTVPQSAQAEILSEALD